MVIFVLSQELQELFTDLFIFVYFCVTFITKMKSYQKKLIPIYVVRILIGLIFLFSGFVKINDPIGFSYKLDEYFHVFDASFGLPYSIFGPWSLNLAFFIGIFETILAINLIFGFAPAFTTTSLLIMIIFFTFLTGYSAVTKKVTDCGCFGDAIKLTPVQSFVKDVFLAGFIGYLYVFRDNIYPFFSNLINTILSIAFAIAIPFYAWFCYNYLPVVDFLPYSVGSDLAYKTTTRGPDGQFLAYGYEPLKSTCGFEEFKGKTLFIVVEDFQKSLPAALNQMITLCNQLKTKGFQVALLTASTSDVRNAFIKNLNISFCVVPQDQTTLKSMIRSNPGLLVLHNGIVKGKFSHKNIPSIEKIISLTQ